MSAAPKVSVVIPSYNHAAYIGEAVSSVLGQTLPDLELIVVDDGSTDHSRAVLESIEDERLNLVFQENRGAHAAINRGLEMAQGETIAILNSDDAYFPNRLEKLVMRLQSHPDPGLAGSHISIISESGRELGVKKGYANNHPWELPFPERSFRASDDLHAALLTENYYATSSNFVFPRSLLDKTGTFRPLRYTHDWDFALRAAAVSALELLPEPLVRYRVHGGNTIRENRAAMVFEICWILAVHLPAYIQSERGRSQPAGFFERLQYSLFTYGCEQVLIDMLLRGLHADERAAAALLDPADQERAYLVEKIEYQLGRGIEVRTAGNKALAFIRNLAGRGS